MIFRLLPLQQLLLYFSRQGYHIRIILFINGLDSSPHIFQGTFTPKLNIFQATFHRKVNIFQATFQIFPHKKRPKAAGRRPWGVRGLGSGSQGD
jgi:hypothetical protein